MSEIEVLTLQEYLLKFKAFQLQRIDKEYDMHLQAWINQQAGSVKSQGDKQVPVFKSFRDFFDYEKRISEIIKPKSHILDSNKKRMARVAAFLNLGMGREEGTDG